MSRKDGPYILVLSILLLTGLSARSAEAQVVSSIEVAPEAEQEFLASNLPFDVGDEWRPQFLELSRKFIQATQRYESFSVDWDESTGVFRVQAQPFLYFEDTFWRGDSVRDSKMIRQSCVNQRELLGLSQQRITEITRCITNQIQGRGYLDARVLVFTEDLNLIIELSLGALYTVSQLEFRGADRVGAAALEFRIRNKTNRAFHAFALQSDTEKIWRYYMRQHYYQVRVSQPELNVNPEEKTVNLVWNIEEGSKIDIEFLGGFRSRRFIEELIEDGEPLPEWFIEGVIDDIQTDLREEGYLDVHVEQKTTTYSDRHRRVQLITKKGPQYRLRKPVWIGLKNPELISEIYSKTRKLNPGKRYGEERYQKLFEESFFRDLVAEGFLDVKVRSLEFNIDRRRAVVEPVIHMSEGTQVVIHKTEIAGVRPVYRNIFEMGRLKDAIKVGRPLDPIVLEAREAEMIDGLRFRGYLDAKIESNWKANVEGHSVEVNIDSGPRYKIADTIIRGLDRTRIKIVRRELLYEEGDFYSRRVIDDTVAQLLRLGLARSIDIQILEKDTKSGLVYLILDVREAARFRFELGPGYGTTDGVRGVFRGTYANIAGTGRRISLFAKASRELAKAKRPESVLNDDAKKEPFIERRVTLEYFEPYMMDIPIDGRIAITHEQEARRQFGVTNNSIQMALDWRINRNWTYSPSYKVEFSDPFNIEITDTAPVDDSSSSRLHSLNQELRASYLDDTFSPQKGIRAVTDLEIFDSFLGGNQNFWILSLSQTFFYPIYRFEKNSSIGFAISFHEGFSRAYSDTKEVPVEKRFRVGGEGSVRAFAEDAIIPIGDDGEPLRNGGLSTFYFRSELNFPVMGSFDILTFFDGGNIYRLNSKFNPMDLRYGAGAGVRFNTPVGPLKFGYAFVVGPKEGEDRGQIYFGVGPL